MSVDKECDIYVESLDMWLVAMILDGAPPVLSTGLLCRENSCLFEQDCSRLPRIVVKDSNGEMIREVTLAVSQECPIICAIKKRETPLQDT